MEKGKQVEYIQDDEERRKTYNKRVKDIIKKTKQLKSMGGVKACTIIYGPDDEASPVVWPPAKGEAERIITAFKSQSEKEESYEEILDKLMKLKMINREMEMENLITDILIGKLTLEQIPPTDLGDLLWVLEDKLRIIQCKKDEINNNNNNPEAVINPSANDECDNLNINGTNNQGTN